MVPCPWFLEIAEAGRADPSLNLGVHLTLTSEKRHYRWRPLTGADPGTGLVDPDGYFWPNVLKLRRHAKPEAVEAELRAQIEAFLRAGLKPTHFDGHQGAALSPEFVDIYIRLGDEYGVPVVFPRRIRDYGPIHNLGTMSDGFYEARAAALAASGHILVDRVLETPWHENEPAEQRCRELFGRIAQGINFMSLHANAAGDIEVIEPASARIRIDEYNTLRADEARTWIDERPFRRGSLSDFRSILPPLERELSL
jgi:predicted glycoside hydrolase/deacetylase ChbG (UPF0249 family)